MGSCATKKPSQNDGFTVIEVMIVLVVAAVIILIVFLAVPALMRMERNRERKFDAGQIASRARECLVASQQVLTACDTMSEVGIDTSLLRLTDDVIFCGSGGVAAETRCTDSYTHPSGNYPQVMALYSYNNDTLWAISVVPTFMIVNYGKVCNNSDLQPTKNSPGKTDMVVKLVLEGPKYTQTICYAT